MGHEIVENIKGQQSSKKKKNGNQLTALWNKRVLILF